MNRVAVLLRHWLSYPLQPHPKTQIAITDGGNGEGRSSMPGGDQTPPYDSGLIKWFWGSFAFLVAIWTIYVLSDPIPSDSEVIHEILVPPDSLSIDVPDKPTPVEERSRPVYDNIESDTAEHRPVETSDEIRESSEEFVSDPAQRQTPSTHIQTPSNESGHMAEKSPSPPLEPELSLERLHLADGPRIISDLRLLGRCKRSDNSCVQIATNLKRRVWLLAFFSIEDRVGVPDCNPRLRAQSRGEHTWRIALTKDRAASPISFHVFATTKREIAERLSEHFRASPGACMANGDLPTWVDELYRHVAMTPDRVAYRHILLVRTAKGFKSRRSQCFLRR